MQTGIVAGYGSVGKRHARLMSELVPRLAVIERNAEARAQAEADHPGAVVAADITALDGAALPWDGAVAVVATWGPSHAEIFHALADRGVRHVLCEKPMASSVADADAMAARAAREGITLGVHHYIRYAGLAPRLAAEIARLDLGDPVSIVIEGGAACLLTNGIHWIDFAAELFGDSPERVVSTASGAPINPRSPDLQLYGGTAVWTFSGGREAVITFTNHSSVALRARVYLRNAVADIESDLSVRIQRRDPAAVERFPAVTRTGAVVETLFEGQLPGVLPYLDGIRSAIQDVSGSSEPKCPGAVGALAVGACVGALVSAREGRAVSLPLDPGHPGSTEQWPIS